MSKLALEVNSKGEVREFDISKNSLEQLQSAVDGLFQPIDINESLIMWVNEEFLFRNDLDPNSMATTFFETVGGTYAIHGTVVFTGGVDSEGDTLGLGLSDRDKLVAMAGSMKSMLVQFGFTS